MGKKSKTGKQRRDKFYHLAKETGYRSRAAFKLIQLNRRYEFLQKSRVLVDLCAAPGGWLQVASQTMPVSSVIVGVDLFPIKPIPNCITLQADITTDKCRQAIKRELKTWKADAVLNDGAPNVGKNWLHDAYQQVTLTLSALKLATEVLNPGGWFVTKVFRSRDYHPLIWVFKQLFKKVYSTKPQASRNESAEIFVVCQGYRAPDKLDPKFLDPHYVFEELEIEPKNRISAVLHSDKAKKVKPEGYPEGKTLLFNRVPVSQFVKEEEFADILSSASELYVDEDWISKHPRTTPELLECLKDIKVLGRKDLRILLTWRKALRSELEKRKESGEAKTEEGDDGEEGEEKSEGDAADDEKDEDEEEMEKIDKQIADLKAEETRDQKRKKKRVLKEKRKLQERMNLKMVIPGDPGPTMEADEMFKLSLIKSGKVLDQMNDQTPDMLAESEEEEEDDTPKPKTMPYNKDSSRLDSSGFFYKESDSEEELEMEESDSDSGKESLGLSDEEGEEEEEANSGGEGQEISDDDLELGEKHPLLTDLETGNEKERKWHKADLWFERDVFDGLENEADEDFELDKTVEKHKNRGGKLTGEQTENTETVDTKDTVEVDEEKEDDVGGDSDDESSDSDYDVEKDMTLDKSAASGKLEIVPKEKVSRKRKLNVEGLALGALMVKSKKNKRNIFDDGWNRYTFNDAGLPDWFMKEEEKHMKKAVPVTKEMMNEYREKLKEINARPIKKVAEAKSRKKRKSVKRMEKARKRAEAILEKGDVTEAEKARQIKTLYKKATGTKKKEVTYIVSKKHQAGKRARRPPGVKGPYKVVDPRMKKDSHNEKKKAKKDRKSKPKGKKFGGGKVKGRKK